MDTRIRTMEKMTGLYARAVLRLCVCMCLLNACSFVTVLVSFQVCLYACMCVYMYVCMDGWVVSVCKYACICVYVCVCMYVCRMYASMSVACISVRIDIFVFVCIVVRVDFSM